MRTLIEFPRHELVEGGIEKVRGLQDMIRVIRSNREVVIFNQVMDIFPEHDEVPNGVGFLGNQRIRLGGVPTRKAHSDGIILESIKFPNQEVFLGGQGVVENPSSHVVPLQHFH